MSSASITIEEILSIDEIYWHFEPRLYYKKEKISASLNEKLIWMPIISSNDYNIICQRALGRQAPLKTLIICIFVTVF